MAVFRKKYIVVIFFLLYTIFSIIIHLYRDSIELFFFCGGIVMKYNDSIFYNFYFSPCRSNKYDISSYAFLFSLVFLNYLYCLLIKLSNKKIFFCILFFLLINLIFFASTILVNKGYISYITYNYFYNVRNLICYFPCLPHLIKYLRKTIP